MKIKLTPSEFKNLKGIEYFKFEEDFIEENVRCIPTIVRFKWMPPKAIIEFGFLNR